MYSYDIQCQSNVDPEKPFIYPGNSTVGSVRHGKDKDLYDFGDVQLLVATDNLSAFGGRLKSKIRGKGRIIAGLSAHWFRVLRSICPNHLISVNHASFTDPIRSVAKEFDGQAMLVWKTDPLPFRCVVRGYLAGAGWREYRETGENCGNILPAGLQESQLLPTPIFTPTTKGRPGGRHENINFHELRSLLGETLAEQLRETSLRLYSHASKQAWERGVLIADTKFEFGLLNGKLMLIDECLTPDTSRFWSIDRYRDGGPLASMDRQILVDFLDTIGTPEMIPLPQELLIRLGEKYHEAYRLITSRRLT